MYPVLLEIGPFEIRTYGVLLSIAFLTGIWLAGKRGEQRGVQPSTLYDLSIYLILSAIVGARAYYVLIHYDDFAYDPLSIFKVWQGGLAMYGGVLLAVAVAYYFTTVRRLSFLRVSDIVAPSLAVGIMVTRVGCYFNGCCFGRETLSSVGRVFPPWSEAGLVFPGTPLHPTQLYASFYGLVIFLVLLMVDRRPHGEGFLFGLFLALYSVSRFTIDFVRYYDSSSSFSLSGARFSYNQIVSIALLVGGILLIAGSIGPTGKKSMGTMGGEGS